MVCVEVCVCPESDCCYVIRYVYVLGVCFSVCMCCVLGVSVGMCVYV